jgi:predicted enzyme related to lactoylglutathione lyase
MGAELIHFDIPAEDPQKLGEFYGEVLGWRCESVAGFEDYVMVYPGDGEGAVGGGIYRKAAPQETVVNYFRVDSIEDFCASVREHGGTVMMEKMAVPGFGYLAVCIDPQGNAFGLFLEESGAS